MSRKTFQKWKPRVSNDEGISSDDDHSPVKSNGSDSPDCCFKIASKGSEIDGAKVKASNGATGYQERLSNELTSLIVDQKESKFFGTFGKLTSKRKTKPTKVYQHDIKLPSQKKYEPVYDSQGIHLATGSDFCDCLDVACPGCHFDCSGCGGNKCGVECRCSRTWCHKEVIQFSPHGPKSIQRSRPGRKTKP